MHLQAALFLPPKHLLMSVPDVTFPEHLTNEFQDETSPAGECSTFLLNRLTRILTLLL